MENSRKISQPKEIIIKKRMLERGYTRFELAQRIKVIPEQISQIVKGDRKTKHIAKGICDELGFDFEVLFFNIKRKR